MKSNLTMDKLNEEIISSDKLIIIDFWATWCGPCMMLSPIIEEISQKYANKIKIYKVNVDEEKELVNKYEVTSIPTLVFLKKEKVLSISKGFVSKKQLEDIISKL